MTIIEIIAAIYLAKILKEGLQKKGQPIWRYIFLGVILLVIGELIGTFIGIMLDLPTAFKYVLSLLGMGLGWHLALTIVDRLEYR